MGWLARLLGRGGNRFRFDPQWKEVMVVTGPRGQFTLYFPMGVPTVRLPTEEAWPAVAPSWAAGLWPQLKAELDRWCEANNVLLELDPKAGVW